MLDRMLFGRMFTPIYSHNQFDEFNNESSM
jgi:hypothetical protein